MATVPYKSDAEGMHNLQRLGYSFGKTVKNCEVREDLNISPDKDILTYEDTRA